MSDSYYIVRAARRYMERHVAPRNWPVFTIARVLACAERAGL